MKKMYIKRTISLLLVLVLAFPVLGLAASGGSLISKVYFQDEAGNMVFVDYKEAIDQTMGGDSSLYNAIKHYVGIAEAKGRAIYLETDSGKVLDYKLAMIDNLFRLEDIMGESKYEVGHEIEYTHELKIVDGEPVIGPKEVHTNYRINIDGPEALEVDEVGSFNVRAYGDGKGNVNYRARYEYTVRGGDGTLEYLDGSTWRELPLSGYFGPAGGFTLTPDWDVTTELRFTPAEEGVYSVELTLIDLDKNKSLADADHTLTVTGVEEEPAELVSITPVSGIEVEFGTLEEVAIGMLPQTTTILDSKDMTHTVGLTWTIENYDGNTPGDYTAVGRFDLPEGIENPRGLELKVEATVKVKEKEIEDPNDFPPEVEDVFVGKSQITNKTYANIEIKEEYVSEVEGVYVDNFLAFQMEDKPSQWRIEVEDGTTAGDLIGRVRVELEEKEVEPQVIAMFNQSFLPKFGYVSVVVENIPGAAKFKVIYHLSDSSDGSQNIEETEIVNIGEEAGLVFYDPAQYDTVKIVIYDIDENLLHIFEDVVLVRQ